jgi:3-methyladenine DNA glycosylase AlkD
MNVQGVMTLLEKHKNERGIEHWKRLTGGKKGKSHGIGLSQLRKLAKQIGRDHELAMKLWASDCCSTSARWPP